MNINDLTGAINNMVRFHRLLIYFRTVQDCNLRLIRLLCNLQEANELMYLHVFRVHVLVVQVGVSNLLVGLTYLSSVFPNGDSIALRCEGYQDLIINLSYRLRVNFHLFRLSCVRVNANRKDRGLRVFLILTLRRFSNYIKDLLQVHLCRAFCFVRPHLPFKRQHLYNRHAYGRRHSRAGCGSAFRIDVRFDCSSLAFAAHAN